MPSKTVACLAMALLVLVARAALLPVWPIPKPAIHDEFSYLLQADTFAHGRLTNPPHPMWRFFESIYILQQPTYASKYPPGQALVLAAGERWLGNPWFGVWLSCGLLAAALCWALQGWMTPGWALLGAFIGFDLCVFTYWMNSYWGGALAAIGGALVVGSWVRMVRARRPGYAWLFGAGCAILLLTRPYEGFLLAAPAAVALWLQVKRGRMRVWVPILLLGAAGLSWQAFYNYRVTGHALRMPYQEYERQYEAAPQLIVLPVGEPKIFRHRDLEFHETDWSMLLNAEARSWRQPMLRARDLYGAALTIFGNPVWVVMSLIFAPVWLRSRRLRVLVMLVGFLVGGAMIERVFFVHYAAPFVAVLLLLLVQCLRFLRVWCARRLPGGRRTAGAVIVVLCAAVMGPDLARWVVHVARHQTPDQMETFGSRKQGIEADLQRRFPDRHVIFVRYPNPPNLYEEWIYNLSDIDGSAVIWAQDMGSENARLIAYYPGRRFWLFEPGGDSGKLAPYRGE